MELLLLFGFGKANIFFVFELVPAVDTAFTNFNICPISELNPSRFILLASTVMLSVYESIIIPKSTDAALRSMPKAIIFPPASPVPESTIYHP